MFHRKASSRFINACINLNQNQFQHKLYSRTCTAGSVLSIMNAAQIVHSTATDYDVIVK